MKKLISTVFTLCLFIPGVSFGVETIKLDDITLIVQGDQRANILSLIELSQNYSGNKLKEACSKFCFQEITKAMCCAELSGDLKSAKRLKAVRIWFNESKTKMHATHLALHEFTQYVFVSRFKKCKNIKLLKQKADALFKYARCLEADDIKQIVTYAFETCSLHVIKIASHYTLFAPLLDLSKEEEAMLQPNSVIQLVRKSLKQDKVFLDKLYTVAKLSGQEVIEQYATKLIIQK